MRYDSFGVGTEFWNKPANPLSFVKEETMSIQIRSTFLNDSVNLAEYQNTSMNEQQVPADQIRNFVLPLFDRLDQAALLAAQTLTETTNELEELREISRNRINSEIASNNQLQDELNKAQNRILEEQTGNGALMVQLQQARDYNRTQAARHEEYKTLVRDTLVQYLGSEDPESLKEILKELGLPGLTKKYRLTKVVRVEMEVEVDCSYDGDGTDLVDVEVNVSGDYTAESNHGLNLLDEEINENEWDVEEGL